VLRGERTRQDCTPDELAAASVEVLEQALAIARAQPITSVVVGMLGAERPDGQPYFLFEHTRAGDVPVLLTELLPQLARQVRDAARALCRVVHGGHAG
jgi:hypothetical protein